jgi:nitrogenase molybdenum-iron protein beta chain
MSTQAHHLTQEPKMVPQKPDPLFRHTTDEILPRQALVANPAKTCQPVGALYAALGVHRCLPHSHGSQGCCSYHRTVLTRHYKEPVMAATSSFTEGSSVFGGQANLLQGLQTIFEVYDPDIVAVHTTCLSETIGDDIPQIIGKAVSDGKIPPGKRVIHTNTPSYQGSHVTGFSNMVRSLVDYFSFSSGKKRKTINIIPGWVEPADMREIKSLCSEMGINIILFPDTSDVLDTPMTGTFNLYPKGGTTMEELALTGDSMMTLALGSFGSSAAAQLLDTKCKVPCQILTLPIGLKATDRFIDTLRTTAGVIIPQTIIDQRGRLVDLMADMHQYTWGKTVALTGDPDQLVGLTEFCLSLDMKVKYVVTGTPGKRFEQEMEELTKELDYSVDYANPSDLFGLHQKLKNDPVDLIIGTTHAKMVARDEDIPFVRYGFPILDRVGHSYFSTLGYEGALRILEKILSALMDRQERDAPNESFELIM